MARIKKGDIVGRKSYNKDILFRVDKILKTERKKIAILKGLIVRIEVDSPIEDLELINKQRIHEATENLENEFLSKIKKHPRSWENQIFNRMCSGKILHLDAVSNILEKMSINCINFLCTFI